MFLSCCVPAPLPRFHHPPSCRASGLARMVTVRQRGAGRSCGTSRRPTQSQGGRPRRWRRWRRRRRWGRRRRCRRRPRRVRSWRRFGFKLGGAVACRGNGIIEDKILCRQGGHENDFAAQDGYADGSAGGSRASRLCALNRTRGPSDRGCKTMVQNVSFLRWCTALHNRRSATSTWREQD
jgi:hypothetical protein